MAEGFTPINSQEEFDAAIQSRLAREKQKHTAEYDALKEQLTSAQNTIATQKATIEGHQAEMDALNGKLSEADTKIKGFQLNELKMKVVKDKGLSYDLAEYLKGETEEELSTSAETLGKLIGKKAMPFADPELDPPKDAKDVALIGMVNELFQK